MPDIREILQALSPEDKTLWQQCRNNMRSVYLNAHNSTVGMAGWSVEDDAFLDLVDIKLAILFDRSGRLSAIKDIIGKQEAEAITKDLHKAEDEMKAKANVVATSASELLKFIGQNAEPKAMLASEGWGQPQ
jgi:hypothetical protein